MLQGSVNVGWWCFLFGQNFITWKEKKRKEGHESYKGFFENCLANFAIFWGKNVRICHI